MSDISNNKINPVKKERDMDNLHIFLNIIKSNWIIILIVFIICIAVTGFYVLRAKDIYKSTTSLLIQKPQGSLLTSNMIPGFSDYASDRSISNEIEILKSQTIRSLTAKALIDSFKNSDSKSEFYYLFNRNKKINSEIVVPEELTEILGSIVSISQKRGLDIIAIDADSPSQFEARLIANAYAAAYLNYNLEFSRKGVKNVGDYLFEIKNKKLNDLTNSEAALQDFQQRGGIVFLDDQAKSIVEQIATLEAQKNASEVELITSRRTYDALKSELERLDPQLITYVESQISQSYIQELQKTIANVEAERNMELTIPKDPKLIEKVKNEYDSKITALKKSLDEKVELLKTGVYAGTPDERKEITAQLLTSGVSIQSSNARFNSLKNLLGKYENEFSKLPSQSIELAKLERNRRADEKLFLLLEEKYQESVINEKSQLGNVSVIDNATLPLKPYKPNRMLIFTGGCVIGLLLGFGIAFLRNFLDRTIKSPEDIESKGISMLAWIPSVVDLKSKGSSLNEFFVANNPKSKESEAFKALRTRIQFSKLNGELLKTILITSSVPSEGKTTVAVNLAGSFALSDKKVLLIDCDLRKPRVHSLFETNRFPGLSDYLFGKVNFEEILNKTKLPLMEFITSGTIPPNPSELLSSQQFKNLLDMLREKYDYVILDSPPFISVTDSEILTRIVDGEVLVALANKTPIDIFLKSYQRLYGIDPHKFLGVVLNNFNYNSVYGYYYNYYYYYNQENKSKTVSKKN
ncbi:MAG TPA: polysaccharide biosynthesis tyrosine autokinase [Ignavibacteria bacterium]|nr:polysaccharide biosynthesis tyrosine autokinase [Ignavibacteria bacterium]